VYPGVNQDAFLDIKLGLNLIEAHTRLYMSYELLILLFPDAVWCPDTVDVELM